MIYAAGVTGISGPTDTYDVTASFRSAEGVSLGTDVRMAGVKIGSVTGMALNPETFRAETTLSLKEGIVLPEDSAVMIAQEGLLGGNYVEITPGGSDFNLEAGGEILDTQGSVSPITLLLKFVSNSPSCAITTAESAGLSR